jgi:pimeloyl-ACP methyl ester carboxylesterase
MRDIDTGIAWRRGVAVVLVLGLGGCSTMSSEQAAPAAASIPAAPIPAGCVRADNCSADAADDAAGFLIEARELAQWAAHSRSERTAMRFWSRCAATAYRALDAPQPAEGKEAGALVTHCTDQFLQLALQRPLRGWSEGPARIDGVELTIEFRRLSPYFGGPLVLTRAQDVPVDLYTDDRLASPGFGVPLAAVAPRCDDRPLCRLLPPEGVFRWATAWIEADAGRDAPAPRLVIADPLAVGPLAVGNRRYPLAVDTSAFYARGVQRSDLQRLGIWGLLGGDEVGRRAGLYLLEDYDPNKRPIVMIHGLGSSPLAWARLSNALWGSPDLRARFQVWHVVYQTDAPLLVTRRRVQGYLDAGWSVLDPEGDDPARAGIVLIGHSLGGLISRMLCVDSGDVLWSAAFTAPPSALRGDPADVALLESTFRFEHYPGVSRAIFMAAPHRGSPTADSSFGRLFRALVGRRSPELQSLRRLAQKNPEAVREELRESYLEARLNSISTLQVSQPVRRAGESLMPVAGIPYHTIAGALPGRQPETDGVVPLASALLPGAASTRVVKSDHKVYESDEAVAEVLRILREDLAQQAAIENVEP